MIEFSWKSLIGHLNKAHSAYMSMLLRSRYNTNLSDEDIESELKSAEKASYDNFYVAKMMYLQNKDKHDHAATSVDVSKRDKETFFAFKSVIEKESQDLLEKMIKQEE